MFHEHKFNSVKYNCVEGTMCESDKLINAIEKETFLKY